MKKSVKIIITVSLAVVITAAIIAGAIQYVKGNIVNEPAEAFTGETGLILTAESNSHISLSVGEVAEAGDPTSVSKSITASVLPPTAVNKAVDWSCEWADSSNTTNVSNYVTVTPASNGSTSATVTCYAAFTGNILVTVTTRENGYTASCVVSFVGAPTDIILTGTIAATTDSTLGTSYKLGIGNTYSYNIALSNVFNSVGSQFNNVTCSIIGIGSMILGYMEHNNASGNDVWYDNSNKTVTLESLRDNFISISHSAGVLTITTVKSIESYYASRRVIDSGRTIAYSDKFRSFVNDCYFKITVKENVSGLTKIMNVRFDGSVVTSVTVNNSSISF